MVVGLRKVFLSYVAYICPCHFKTPTSSGPTNVWLKVLAILMTIDDTFKEKLFEDFYIFSIIFFAQKMPLIGQNTHVSFQIRRENASENGGIFCRYAIYTYFWT